MHLASIASTSAAGNITINSEFGTLSGGANGIVATTAGSGSITITGAGSVTGNTNRGIDARLSNSGATGDLSITASGAVSGGSDGIYALNAGTGTTSITVASVSASAGSAILTRTRAGANITVNAGGTVSGGAGNAAIQTGAPSGDSSSTPADSYIRGTVSGGNISTLAGADTVTLAAGSTTTGVAIDLGAGDDTLNLASATFGTLDGGADADTLSISGTGITLDGGAHSGFETLTFAAGSNTLSGAHVGLTVTNFNAGTTILTGSLASTTAAVASGAALDLAAGSSLSGDLSNSGMLTVAGTGFGSATITGDLVLNADGTLTLDTNGAGGETDLLMVSGAVTLGGTLMLRQTTMPAGTVTLIDGGTALSGNFASSNEMSTEGLVNGLLISQTLVQDGINFDLQLVTTVTTPVPMPDPEFPTGCTVTPVEPACRRRDADLYFGGLPSPRLSPQMSMESASSSARVPLKQPSCPPRVMHSLRLLRAPPLPEISPSTVSSALSPAERTALSQARRGVAQSASRAPPSPETPTEALMLGSAIAARSATSASPLAAQSPVEATASMPLMRALERRVSLSLL